MVQALNEDMPFNEFTTLQLTADLLENPTPDLLADTGFHRNTLRNREGGTTYQQSRFEKTLDRANTVATAWLGLTVDCAQCHNHKYDPISQRDFYSLYAFFDNVEDLHIDAPLPGAIGVLEDSRRVREQATGSPRRASRTGPATRMSKADEDRRCESWRAHRLGHLLRRAVSDDRRGLGGLAQGPNRTQLPGPGDADRLFHRLVLHGNFQF